MVCTRSFVCLHAEHRTGGPGRPPYKAAARLRSAAIYGGRRGGCTDLDRTAGADPLDMTSRTDSPSRRRPRMLAAVALAASVLVLIAVVTSRSGTTRRSPRPSAWRCSTGSPSSGEWLGAPDAPVVVEEYADLQCPFCADFATRGLPPIVARLRPAGRGPDAAAPAGLPRAGFGRGSARRRRGLEQDRGGGTSPRRSTPARARRTRATSPRTSCARSPATCAASTSTARSPRRARPRAARRHRTAAAAAGVDSTPSFRVGRRGGPMRTVSAEQLPAAYRRALATVTDTRLRMVPSRSPSRASRSRAT